MACDITATRSKVCKDSNGGIKNVYFINDGAITSYTYDATDTDLITTVVGSPSAYKWELLNGGSNYEETITSSSETGTTVFIGSLNLIFPKMTVADNKEVKLMAWNTPKIILEDNNGNFLLIGKDRGCNLDGGTIATGGATSDLSGYTLVFASDEKAPYSFLDASDEAGLTAMGFTIV